MKKYTFPLLLCLFFLTGCLPENEPVSPAFPATGQPGDIASVRIALTSEQEVQGTKSVVSTEVEGFRCAYLFAFRADDPQKSVWTYADGRPIALYTRDKNFEWPLPVGLDAQGNEQRLDVWVLVNPPESQKETLENYVSNRPNLKESDLEALLFTLEDTSSMLQMEEAGMPMSGMMNGVVLASQDAPLTVTVRRLFAKYDIILDVSLFENAGWTIRTAKVNAARSNTSAPYFYCGTGAGYKQMDGNKLRVIDTTTGDDLENLDFRDADNRSRAVSFYFLENCQGDLYADDDDAVEASRWNKVAAELGDKVANCSYLDMFVVASKPGYGDRSFKYRLYLGDEPAMKKNFDIIRNKYKRLVIRLGSDSSDGFIWTSTADLQVFPEEIVVIPFETSLKQEEIAVDCLRNGISTEDLQSVSMEHYDDNLLREDRITDYRYRGTITFKAKLGADEGLVEVWGGDIGHDIWTPSEVEIAHPINFYAGLGLTDAGADLGEGDPAEADTWIKTFPVIISSNINPLDYIVTAGFEPVDRFPLSEFNPHSKSLIKIYGWIHNGDNADGTTNYEVVYGFDFSNFGETAQDIHPDFAAIPYNVTLYIRHKDDPDWPEENIDPDNPATAGNEWFHFKKHCAMYVGATPTKEVVSTDTYNAEYVMTVTPVWGPCIPVGIKFDEVTGTLSDASVVTVMNTSNEYYDIIKAPASAPLPVEAAGRLYPSSIDGELSYQRLPGDPDQYSVTFNGKNSVGADWANKFMYYNAPLFYDWDAQPWVELDDELRLYLYPYGSLSGYWELDSVRGQDYKWFNYNADTSVRIKSRNSRYEFDFYTCIDYGRNDIGATNYRLYTGDYAFTFKTIQNPNPNEEEIPVFEYDGHSATIQTPRGVKNIEDVISSIDLTVVPKFRTLYYDMDYVHYYVSYAFTNLTGTNKNIIQLTPASAEVTGNYWYFRGFPTRERPRSLHNVETPPANVEKYGRFTSFTIENDSHLEDKKYGGYKRWQEIFVMDNYFIRADIRFKAEYADLVKDWNIRTNLKETFPVWINDTYF